MQVCILVCLSARTLTHLVLLEINQQGNSATCQLGHGHAEHPCHHLIQTLAPHVVAAQIDGVHVLGGCPAQPLYDLNGMVWYGMFWCDMMVW